MSRPFKFKKFTIVQEQNAHKVGTDSMILGAWVSTGYNRILDIGTGTGVLALMMAQKNPTATITAIEPQAQNIQEAQINFQNSPYSHRIMAVPAMLQDFSSLEKYDLIISNPPYFDQDYKAVNAARNQARHTDYLSIYDLYAHSVDLLAENGRMAVVLPVHLIEKHLAIAEDEGLFAHRILKHLDPEGFVKRYFIEYTREAIAEVPVTTLTVKDTQNRYSAAYIALTQDFHNKDLSATK